MRKTRRLRVESWLMRCSRNSQMALVQRGLPCYALMEEFHQSPRFLPVGLHLLDGSEILPQAWFEADQAFSSAPCSGTEASVRECAESQPAASSELQVAADTQVSPVFLMGCPAALLTEDWILPSRSLRPWIVQIGWLGPQCHLFGGPRCHGDRCLQTHPQP